MTATARAYQPPSAEAGMLPRPFRVVARRQELADCVSLELAPVEGAPPDFAPGQFAMLYVHGVGEIPVSISGDPSVSERLVHTIREVGAVTGALCRLQEGARVGVRGPYGSAWPLERAFGRHLVAVAGGLGLAPLRPLVHWALANRHRLKSVALVYGTRAPDNLLFADQLRAWAASDSLDVGITVDRATADWQGRVGLVSDLLPGMIHDPAETVAMLCGPELMMRFVAQALDSAGVPQADIHLSMERNMKCGLGWCGHCQLGPFLTCRDGPVLPYAELRRLLTVWEL